MSHSLSSYELIERANFSIWTTDPDTKFIQFITQIYECKLPIVASLFHINNAFSRFNNIFAETRDRVPGIPTDRTGQQRRVYEENHSGPLYIRRSLDVHLRWLFVLILPCCEPLFGEHSLPRPVCSVVHGRPSETLRRKTPEETMCGQEMTSSRDVPGEQAPLPSTPELFVQWRYLRPITNHLPFQTLSCICDFNENNEDIP